MPTPHMSLRDVALVPIPWILLDELDLDPYTDFMQMYIRRGRLIIEHTDADENLVCIGSCCRCPGKDTCEVRQE